MRRRILLIVFATNVFFATLAYFQVLSWGWIILPTILQMLALHDILQSKHTLLRNFPVIAHLRYILESIRPEIQQYFVESDITEDPISRIYRNVVYEKAKGELETVPFGSELNFYAEDYQWINHSCFPVSIDDHDFRVLIGNDQCRQPYNSSMLSVSAMSYGSISDAAVTALGQGAKAGGFSLNTGEGGISPHHLATGADLVWQLGTAYFGARDSKGYFDPVSFRLKAVHPNIKMIEIKISQGAKPGHGGILPGVKVDAEVAQIRQVEIGKTVVSPPGHTAFTTPEELCYFIKQLRDLSDGKPIGFKLCLGRREEFVKICEAMVTTGVVPDFITVDGGEGGTGAAPFDFINFVGSPLKEALYFIHCRLKEYGLRDQVKVIASGKIFTAFNIFEKLALGADLCNSARGMMLALGCIQAYRCNTNKCPVGITTNDPHLVAGLNIPDKSERVANYHRRTLEELADILGAAGLHRASDVDLKHISRRQDGRILTLSELFSRTTELSSNEERDRSLVTRGEPRAPTPPQDP